MVVNLYSLNVISQLLFISVRSSTLTGKFVHNHHTYENSVGKGCNAPSWRNLNEHKTIGAYMTSAGYKTGFFGTFISAGYSSTK